MTELKEQAIPKNKAKKPAYTSTSSKKGTTFSFIYTLFQLRSTKSTVFPLSSKVGVLSAICQTVDICEENDLWESTKKTAKLPKIPQWKLSHCSLLSRTKVLQLLTKSQNCTNWIAMTTIKTISQSSFLPSRPAIMQPWNYFPSNKLIRVKSVLPLVMPKCGN